MTDEVDRLKLEISQLEKNYEFLIEYYKIKIKDKRLEKDNLVKNK